MNKKVFWLLMGIGAVLRLLLIWKADLWYDENFTLLVARLPLDQMMAAIAGDVHPPLWYFIALPFARLGPAWLIRLPAAMFAIANIFLFYRVACIWLNSQASRSVALALFVLSPAMLYYAQEGRMYSLLVFWVLLAVWMVYSSSEYRFHVLILALLGMLYTHNYGVFYAAVIALAAAFHNRHSRRDLILLVMSCFTAGIGWSLWAVSAFAQAAAINGTYWITGSSLPSLLVSMFRIVFVKALPVTWELPAAALLFAGIALALAYYFTPLRSIWYCTPLLLLAFAPGLLALLVSALFMPVVLHRPLIATLPFLFILLAKAVQWLQVKTHRWMVAAAFAVPLVVAGMVGVYTANVRQSWHDPLAYIQSHWQAGDVIVHSGDGTWINWAPYTDLPMFLETQCDHTLGELTDKTRTALGMQVMDHTAIEGRVWYVYGSSPLTPPCLQRPAAMPVLVADDTEYTYLAVYLEER